MRSVKDAIAYGLRKAQYKDVRKTCSQVELSLARASRSYDRASRSQSRYALKKLDLWASLAFH